jgi:hypothetical protein
VKRPRPKRGRPRATTFDFAAELDRMVAEEPPDGSDPEVVRWAEFFRVAYPAARCRTATRKATGPGADG